jgi:GNAT superfamily N-acetyltransferase
MEKRTLYLSPGQIEKKFEEAGIGLKETLALIEMTWENTPDRSPLVPFRHLFQTLDRLTHHTVKGSRIKRFRPPGPNQPFQIFEVYTREKEVLAYLNMVYLRKPLPCYYLVYVEVTPAFRGKGLGNRILEAFRDLMEEKGALGLLDNIIPPDDPTFDIYSKLGWLPIEDLIGAGEDLDRGHYMVYLPAQIKKESIRVKLPKLIFNLKKKRPVIEMQDNELMVRRTIQEFQDIYTALEKVFQQELEVGQPTPLMRFMFTKFTTRLLGFQRRIQELLGYTGGESLEQIKISPAVRALPILPYTFDPESPVARLQGDTALWASLPETLTAHPTKAIETLPLYQRPFLKQWLKDHGREEPLLLTIDDLLDLGFDPTRLRECSFQDAPFMFERISPLLLGAIGKRKALLEKIEKKATGVRIQQARVRINPPLLWLEDRGNGYILRAKLKGIHWEEAVFQLKQNPDHRFINQQLFLDQRVSKLIREVKGWIAAQLKTPQQEGLQDLAIFVPWNLERNSPLFSIDMANQPYLETVWVA